MKTISSAIVTFSGVHLFQAINLVPEVYRIYVLVLSIIVFFMGMTAWLVSLFTRTER